MLLDTSAYSALARGVSEIVTVVADQPTLQLPLPVVAELRYGFTKGTYAERNEQMLQNFLAQPQISLAIPSLETTTHYAALQLLCQQRGRALSHNDIWIAALAHEADESLVTFDQDFIVFTDIFGDQLIILTEA